jgi:alpha-N-arabinofuranosidase
MPNLAGRNIKLAIDEWAGGGFTGFTRALCAAEGLQEMFRHSDVIKMAAYTAFISNLNFDGSDAVLSSVGLVFRLYRQHFGIIPLEVSGNSPQNPVKGTIGVDRARVPSGSPTYPMDVAAALTTDRKKLTVALVNPTEKPQEIEFNIAGVQLRGSGRMWRIAAPNLDADNVPGKRPELEIAESPVREVPKALALPPLSISLWEFEVK